MATLHDIKRRIGSVKNTQKITRAMKMVAASKLKRAQEAITVARPYAHRMRDLVNNLALRADLDLHPLLNIGSATRKIGIIVVASDRGLCGAFNSSVVNTTLHHIRETFPDKTVELTLVGKKCIELLKRKHDTIAETYLDVQDDPENQIAASIIDTAAQSFISGEIEELYCLYNEFKSAISQDVVLEKILPFQPTEIAEGERDTNFIYEPSEEKLFEELLTRHMKIQMHRVLSESAASEHGARMTAMEAATTNAGDMIDRLTLEYNRARQSAITTELFEVVSGAESL
ncbi:MAG: ATP synthase F1 subunit gamma [Candidatus Hydrogenedentota bacterium]